MTNYYGQGDVYLTFMEVSRVCTVRANAVIFQIINTWESLFSHATSYKLEKKETGKGTTVCSYCNVNDYRK